MAWNWFDFFCIVTQALDIALTYSASGEGGQSLLVLVKMLRLARLSRLVRLLRFKMFRELKLMIFGLFCGLRALCWAVVLLIFMIYTLGIIMRSLSTEPEFHSMPSSMFTLFRCFTDGCSAYDGTPLSERLREKHGFLFFASYILITMIVSVGLFNLIMAVFIDNVTKSQGQRKMREIGDSTGEVCAELKLQIVKFMQSGALMDDAGHPLERMSEKARAKLQRLGDQGHHIRDAAKRQMFADLAFQILLDDGVTITRDMFLLWLEDVEFMNLLDDADVDVSDKFSMFDILDVDMGGELSADELVTGLMQLRGDVSKGNIVHVILKVRHLTTEIEEVQRMLRGEEESILCPKL
eukprot:TRINITY_DN69160_c0_g1_i1.p1 TRINITY_DN69160_c0_g1~~TRINITY_DN69160_c0_g1_i1.p1  ORF type:complete len:412 (-),score=69.67 TRINITY_DN69160_c0_g1_i1:150-1205(-)